jgi:prepilin-type processing-associated H-X9-DG protein
MPSVNSCENNFGTEVDPPTIPFGKDIAGKSNYCGVAGEMGASRKATDGTAVNWTYDGTPGGTSRYKGIFYALSRTKIKDIIDGTTKTMMVAERDGSYHDNYLKPLGMRGRKAAVWEGPIEAVYQDEYLVNVSDTLAGGAYLINAAIPGTKSTAYSVGSLHKGGANVTMADGSVRFIAESIDSPTWKALGGISDGVALKDY